MIPNPERPDSPDVRSLLQAHFDLMRSQSPAESCHVMEPDSLADPGVSLLGLRRDGLLLGIGALSMIAPTHAELKSMHTAKEARGQGIARRLLHALIALGRDNGVEQISLETGTQAAFAPARALYLAEGFQPCPPFGEYVADPLSIFMTRRI